MYLRFNKTRFVYVSLAIFCLIIFVTSSLLVMKYHKKDTNMVSQRVEVREVFSQERLNIGNENRFFLKVISTTNSSISLFFKEEFGENTNIIDLNLGEYFGKMDLRSYLNSQFPAIFTFSKNKLDTSIDDNSVTDKEIIQNPEVLEDLIYIEDEAESEEGELVEEREVKLSTEGIPNPEGIETLKVNKEKPYVLIYHTHGTEAYLPIKDNRFHTTERKYNMLTIGKIVSDSLTSYGHKVSHIDVYHDTPSYNKSYARSLNTITNAMKENENLKVVFDLHRDGIEEDASYIEKAKEQSKIVINEKDIATFSLVIGPDSPNMDKVLKFNKYIKSVSDQLYPGLCKGIIIKPTGRFNQYVTDYYALIEVGSNLNTIEEAKESAKLISEILSIVIEKLQE
ncbi:stage II sporulation protein P [Anaerosalibacter sp. Marseille-P3206]|uniref:stage II sporulation protein P n=1 Tax=Anaerosalibacter sp. Marseille-P3206 TaxID=1871005 RepID=UPI0009871DD4|nr:stage II sporulation protein P [Anaerosalibacter sp. Marseille-P3206]